MTRVIPIRGKPQQPAPKGKRRSPRCHIVVSHFRKGAHVESYRRPRGCIFVPQVPFRPRPPRIPPPPPAPKPPAPRTNIPVEQIRRYRRLLESLRRLVRDGKNPDLFAEILEQARGLNLVDGFGFKSNRTVANEVLNRILRARRKGYFPKFTDSEINALVQRGLIKNRGAMTAIRGIDLNPEALSPWALDTVFQRINDRGAPTPASLRDMLDDALSAIDKDNVRYLEEVEAFTRQSKQFADDAANILRNYANEVGKVRAITNITRVLPYIFGAVDAGLGLWEGEDPLRAFGGAASSFGAATAATAACSAAGIATGGIALAVCGAIGGFVGGWAFDRTDETGVIRNLPKRIGQGLRRTFERLPIPGRTPAPSPAPSPSPTPTPTPTPRPPAPSPRPAPTPKPPAPKPRPPAPTPRPTPSPLPQGIRQVGQGRDNKPRYETDTHVWTRRANGEGFWRRQRGAPKNAPRPTFNPDTKQTITPTRPSRTPTPDRSPSPPTPSRTPDRSPPSPTPTPQPSPPDRPQPSPSPRPTPTPMPTGTPPNIIPPNIIPPNIVGAPSPTPSPSPDRPTDPEFTCVIRRDGTGFWRRKRGVPEDTPRPSIPCKPI